jgi:hypothetical protein
MNQHDIERAVNIGRQHLARNVPLAPSSIKRGEVDIVAVLSNLPLPLMAQAVVKMLETLAPNANWWQRIAIQVVSTLLVNAAEGAAEK